MLISQGTDIQYGSTPVQEVWKGNNLVWIRSIYWTGLGSDNNWSTAANWSNGQTPVAPSPLEFAGTTRLSAFNDFPIDTTFNGITFNSSSGMFQLTGNKFVLGTQGIANNSINNQTINNNISLSLGSKTMNCSSGPITFTGVLSGSGSIVKNGSQALTYTGACNYTGGTTINQGTLTVTAASVLNGVISGSGSLTKTGTAILTLGGNNTYSGGTSFVSGGLAGYILYTSSNAFGTGLFTLSNSAGRIDTGSSVTLPNDFQLNTSLQTRTLGANTITVTGNIAGSGGIDKTGNGTLILSGALTYTGQTIITRGFLQAFKTTGASTATASFNNNGTTTVLNVSFNVSPPSGVTTFRFFQGSTSGTWTIGALTGVPAGTTATYNSSNSTLSVSVP
jgi:fibronectin-binding autotransporter adhesin